jgi:hypothetical protein
MALKGTLKDFGIADILQLIGQQQKTGVLYIKSKVEEVEVTFLEGQVMRALSKTRQSRERLGAMLVSCALLTQDQLDEALDIQKRTLKRLGDILVAEGRVTAQQLREMTQLQTTETVYKLFSWNNGTYEFVQQDVEHDPAQGLPIRPESVLMEGFRRIDEWPMIRRRVTSMGLTFERLKHLEPPPASPDASGEDVDAALDAALDSSNFTATVAPKSIGRHERLVFKLAESGATAERLCETSRLGEFETCKALYNLLEAGYLKANSPKKGERGESTGIPGVTPDTRRRFAPEVVQALRGRLAQIGIALLIIVLFAIAANALGTKPQTAVQVLPADASGTRRAFSDAEMARLIGAVELYRLLHGKYPDHLNELVLDGLVDREELRYPSFETEYHYRVQGESYVLLPPLR